MKNKGKGVSELIQSFVGFTQMEKSWELISEEVWEEIQRKILPDRELFKKVFKDASVLWEPRDMAGGDIYWLKEFEQGTVLCVCDCSGHGVSGALQTLLVTSILEENVTEEKCTDPAWIVWKLDSSLNKMMKTKEVKEQQGVIPKKVGCKVAVFYISREHKIFFSSSEMNVFICSKERFYQFGGQNLCVGEGGLRNRKAVEIRCFKLDSSEAVYIVTDGLLDQIENINRKGNSISAFSFIESIKMLHGEKQQDISDSIWDAFKLYLEGQESSDDVTMISFRIK